VSEDILEHGHGIAFAYWLVGGVWKISARFVRSQDTHGSKVWLETPWRLNTLQVL
jgi:hypothetical protein